LPHSSPSGGTTPPVPPEETRHRGRPGQTTRAPEETRHRGRPRAPEETRHCAACGGWTSQLLPCAARRLTRGAEPEPLATCRERSVMGTTHSQRTGSPSTEKPDRSGTGGPASSDGSSSSSTPSYPPPSGKVDGLSYQRTLCPGPNQVTERHGYPASHKNTSAATPDGSVVATASSIRQCSAGSSTTCSTTGIRCALIPIVDSTVYGRPGAGGRSEIPIAGRLPCAPSQ